MRHSTRSARRFANAPERLIEFTNGWARDHPIQ
nr:MAG TPA: hypothetical protein [Caudoviricetes sp.]